MHEIFKLARFRPGALDQVVIEEKMDKPGGEISLVAHFPNIDPEITFAIGVHPEYGQYFPIPSPISDELVGTRERESKIAYFQWHTTSHTIKLWEFENGYSDGFHGGLFGHGGGSGIRFVDRAAAARAKVEHPDEKIGIDFDELYYVLTGEGGFGGTPYFAGYEDIEIKGVKGKLTNFSPFAHESVRFKTLEDALAVKGELVELGLEHRRIGWINGGSDDSYHYRAWVGLESVTLLTKK